MTAYNVYNGLLPLFKQTCSNNQDFMEATIEQSGLSEDESLIFRELIKMDGCYTPSNTKTSGELKLLHLEALKKAKTNTEFEDTEQKSFEDTETNKPKQKQLHWKLKTLSCIQNKSNLLLSNSRRKIAMMINEKLNLDGIAIERLQNMISKIGKIENLIKCISNESDLSFIGSFKKLNVTDKIESNQGTVEITNVIDHLCFLFVKWDTKFMEIISKCDKIKCDINNTIISLKIGCYNGEQLQPLLAAQEYDIKLRKVITFTQGTVLYDHLKEYKKKLNNKKKEMQDLNELIQEKRKNILYRNYLSKKRKNKRTLTENERSERHKRKFIKKNKKRNKKKKTSKKANKQTSKGQMQLSSFWKRKRNANIEDSDAEPPKKRRRKMSDMTLTLTQLNDLEIIISEKD